VARQRFQALLLSSFGILGLALAILGVYGVLSLSVTRRTAEIGVRVALGATRGDVTGQFLAQGLKAVGAGLALGLVIAFFTADLVADLLWGIEPTDLPTYAACTVGVLLAGLAATCVSIRRAMGIDPVEALRRE
jgi:ABC-type antimicrobial peptide transport system permease subunit